jgi:hypothetical protein
MSNPGEQHPEETNIRSAGIRSLHIRVPDFDFDTPGISIANIRSPHIRVPDIDFDTPGISIANISETIVEVKHLGRSVGLAVVPERVVRAFFSRSNVARPIDPAHVMIPEIGLQILPFIVPRKLRDAVTGDLTEDFRTFAVRWGRPYALRWLWWELGGLCIRRFGPTAFWHLVSSEAGVVTLKLRWPRGPTDIDEDRNTATSTPTAMMAPRQQPGRVESGHLPILTPTVRWANVGSAPRFG